MQRIIPLYLAGLFGFLCTCAPAQNALIAQGIVINLTAAGVGHHPIGDCDKNLAVPDCSEVAGNQHITVAPGALYGFYLAWENDGLATFTEVRATDQLGNLLFAPRTTPLPPGGTDAESNFRNAPLVAGSYEYLVTVTATEENGRQDTDQFRYFVIVDAALPVELSAFTATPLAKGKVALRWRTTHEHEHDYFEVERLKPNGSFAPIGRVGASGHGTTGGRAYRFVDELAPGGELFYRLRQVDLDGSSVLSAAVRVVNATTEPRCWPNPARDHLYVAGVSDGMARGASGQTVRLPQTATGRFDVSGLAPGWYSLRTAKGMVRFVKL